MAAKSVMEGTRFFDTLFKKSAKREDDGGESSEEVTFTTQVFTETRRITWKIENFKFSPLKAGEYHESPQFSTGFQFCTKWTLRVYPRGTRPRDTPMLAIHLHKGVSPNVKVKAQFELKLGNLEDAEKNMISVLHMNDVFMTPGEADAGLLEVWHGFDGKSSERACAVENFLGSDSSNLSGVKLSGNSMKIICILNVSYIEDQDYYESSSPGCSGSWKDETLPSDFKEILSNGKFSDVKFQIGDKEIPAHKAILAARSQYFAAMFDHPTEENQTNVVNVEDVEFPLFKDFLHYVYASEVEDLTADKAVALYSVADKYVLDKLRKLCARVILANVRVDNVCKIAALGYRHSDTRLKSAANHVFRKFKHQIFERKEWKEMAREQQHLVSEILRDLSSDFHSTC